MDNMKRWVIGMAVLGWAAGGARAAEEVPARPAFTLAECVELGLRQAAAARNARRDEEIAGTRIGQVRAQVLPEL